MERQIEALVEWGRSHGCMVNDKIQFVAGEEGCGITAVATTDIPKDEVLVSCVDAVMIGPSLAQKHFGPIANNNGLLQIAIRLAFVRERLLGNESGWSAYINALPSLDTMPSYYNEEDSKWVANTNLALELNSRTQKFKDEFVRAQQELGLGNEYTFEDYHWACNVFSSRAFPAKLIYEHLPDVSLLAPIIDLFNHRPMEPVDWTSAYNQFFELSIGRNITKGEQVFNNYGGKGNEELLISYGFCFKNRHDVVSLRLASLPNGVKEAVANVPENLTFSLSDYDPLPENLQQVFQYIVKANEQFEDDTIAMVCGLERLKPALMAKYWTLQKHFDQLPEPANLNQRNVSIYIKGQLSVYESAIAKLKSRVNDLKSSFKTQLQLDTIDQRFLEAVTSVYGAESMDELVDMDTEDSILIIYMCMTKSLAPSNDGAEYNMFYTDVVEPFHRAAPQTFDLQRLTPGHLATAGNILSSNGFSFRDDQARERYCVLWNDE